MDTKERESIIEQLSLITGYSKQYYQLKTDEELKKELARTYGES